MAPNEWGNDEVFLVYDHRDFYVEEKGFNPEEIFDYLQETGNSTYEGYWVFPVYAYIHSGVSLSLSRNTYPHTCPWDTSFRGFALVKREKGTWKEDDAYERASGLIDEWNMYLSGDVYGYNSEVGGCWGFFGREMCEQMITEAKAEIDYHIEQKTKKHLARLKDQIKNGAPLYARQSIPLDNITQQTKPQSA